ncbi:hypothetical protein BZG01_16405 [Labilibaculum manganireducens]|uniref:Zn-binding Pro-Ala-Ala-Arg (PAAR) domain-containing protein, incolved in TypeVI secretion n=1 Tax=Labilibaculum manganireducens TaxID=1940525 RepID=A0A2N3HY18_9BACT|nr:PAAR domain-containing protein [Labilibaculum manganireducens]PKQ62965.1 hypothetical protein BZG01_16405 [Labilibaculum manganireducens]
MPGPAATLGSMHVCPMVTGYVPHVGGPVSGPGVPTVLIGGKPAAVMGDMCTCVGPPDTIVQGEATVLIGGKPAATIGSMTAHGGSITVGEPTVLIGTGGSGATAVTPVTRIPFPKITPLQKFKAVVSGNGAQLNQAIANQDALRQQAEEQALAPKIIKAEFFDDETDERIDKGKLIEVIKMRVFTKDFADGDTVSIDLKRSRIKDKDGNKLDDEEVVTLTGTVNSDVAIVEYEVPDYSKENE